MAAVLVGISGITDMLDGKVARHGMERLRFPHGRDLGAVCAGVCEDVERKQQQAY